MRRTTILTAAVAAALLSGCEASGGGTPAPSGSATAPAPGPSTGNAASPGTAVPAQLLLATDAVKGFIPDAKLETDRAGDYPIAQLCKQVRAEPLPHTSHRRYWSGTNARMTLTGHAFTKAEDAQHVQSARSVADSCDTWNAPEGDFYKLLGPAAVPDGVAAHSSSYGVCYEMAMEGDAESTTYCTVWLTSGTNALTITVSGPAGEKAVEQLLAKAVVPASLTLVSAPGSQKG